MEPIYASISLENSCRTQFRAREVRALVKAETLFLCLPTQVVAALELKAYGFRMVNTPGGMRERGRYVGPVTLQWGSHVCFTGAVEFGDEVVLGSMALDALDLNVDPLKRRLAKKVPRRFSYN